MKKLAIMTESMYTLSELGTFHDPDVLTFNQGHHSTHTDTRSTMMVLKTSIRDDLKGFGGGELGCTDERVRERERKEDAVCTCVCVRHGIGYLKPTQNLIGL